MEAVHESLHEVQPGCVRGLSHLLRLDRVHAQRLLAQDVLARGEGFERPLPMHRVDQRDVDRVDLRIVEERLIGFSDARHPVLRGHRARPLAIAAGDRHQAAIARSGDGGHDRLGGDVRRAQYAPADLPFYMEVSIGAPPREMETVAASITATVRRAWSGVTASGSLHPRWSARLR